MLDIQAYIKELIQNYPILLFIKGTKNNPQCGFSETVVNILTSLSVEFYHVNVLENPIIRDGIKKYSDWPTIPQLYIKKVFIGGCDIVQQLYHNGELQERLKSYMV